MVLVPEPENDSSAYEAAAADAYYDNNLVFDPNMYENAAIEDVTNFYDDNKESPFYSCPLNNQQSVKIQAMPIRKVQTVSATINDKIDV